MKKLTLVALAAGLLAAGCGSDESREDANDVHNGQVDKSAPSVSAFNNKFPNLEHKCLYDRADGSPRGQGLGLRVIVNTNKRFIVIPDPHCPGFRPEQAGTAGAGSNTP